MGKKKKPEELLNSVNQDWERLPSLKSSLKNPMNSRTLSTSSSRRPTSPLLLVPPPGLNNSKKHLMYPLVMTMMRMKKVEKKKMPNQDAAITSCISLPSSGSFCSLSSHQLTTLEVGLASLSPSLVSVC